MIDHQPEVTCVLAIGTLNYRIFQLKPLLATQDCMLLLANIYDCRPLEPRKLINHIDCTDRASLRSSLSQILFRVCAKRDGGGRVVEREMGAKCLYKAIGLIFLLMLQLYYLFHLRGFLPKMFISCNFGYITIRLQEYELYVL